MQSPGYEQSYRDAKEALYRRGKRIGNTLRDMNRVRFCSVDGVALTDYELLAEAWGQSLADEIFSGSAGAPLGEICRKCDFLSSEHDLAVQRYRRIFTNQLSAERRRDLDEVNRLSSMLRQASELQFIVRRSLLKHASVHLHTLG